MDKIVNDFETKGESVSIVGEELYQKSKNELEELHNLITEGYILRSKCQWYEEGEKSNKFFLNLEKKKGVKSTIRSLIDDDGIQHRKNKEILKHILLKHILHKIIF